MYDILHRVGAVAPLSSAYRALATVEGLAGWWTTDVTGSSEVGGKLEFRFGDLGGFDMEVLELDPSGTVRWRVIDGPPEWVGTEIVFVLTQCDDFAIVRFRHSGWREQVEFMDHCSTKWATFLMSLTSYVETGVGRPAPEDVKVSNWH